MLRPWQKAVVVVLLGNASVWAMPQQVPQAKPNTKVAAKQKTSSRKPVQKEPEPIQLVQPAPPTPEQMPATAPQVTMSNGLLSITATNSTMGDVLSAVRRQTGAAIEVPPGYGGDRIAVKIGPGQPKDVIASLLDGSRFDYIILGSLQKPGGIDRIILSSRQNMPATQPNGAQNALNRTQAPPHAPPPSVDVDTESEEDNAPERDAADVPAEVEQEQPPTEQAPPNQPGQTYQPVPTPQGQADQQQQQNGQPQVKSPEELLRELQQMRQQQQNQTPPQDTPNQPPQ
jgi:hypothetical protein